MMLTSKQTAVTLDALNAYLSDIRSTLEWTPEMRQDVSATIKEVIKELGGRDPDKTLTSKEIADVCAFLNDRDKKCPYPQAPCTCTTGIGCVNVPYSRW
jgi:hypothetical protein